MKFAHKYSLHRHPTYLTASLPSQGGSLEDSAYRCYRKRSGEEALLERKQKQRRIGSSLDYFCKRDVRDMHKAHYQYLVKLHQESPSVNATHCTSGGCDHPCMPYSTRCSRRILKTQLNSTLFVIANSNPFLQHVAPFCYSLMWSP